MFGPYWGNTGLVLFLEFYGPSRKKGTGPISSQYGLHASSITYIFLVLSESQGQSQKSKFTHTVYTYLQKKSNNEVLQVLLIVITNYVQKTIC